MGAERGLRSIGADARPAVLFAAALVVIAVIVQRLLTTRRKVLRAAMNLPLNIIALELRRLIKKCARARALWRGIGPEGHRCLHSSARPVCREKAQAKKDGKDAPDVNDDLLIAERTQDRLRRLSNMVRSCMPACGRAHEGPCDLRGSARRAPCAWP